MKPTTSGDGNPVPSRQNSQSSQAKTSPPPTAGNAPQRDTPQNDSESSSPPSTPPDNNPPTGSVMGKRPPTRVFNPKYHREDSYSGMTPPDSHDTPEKQDSLTDKKKSKPFFARRLAGSERETALSTFPEDIHLLPHTTDTNSKAKPKINTYDKFTLHDVYAIYDYNYLNQSPDKRLSQEYQPELESIISQYVGSAPDDTVPTIDALSKDMLAPAPAQPQPDPPPEQHESHRLPTHMYCPCCEDMNKTNSVHWHDHGPSGGQKHPPYGLPHYSPIPPIHSFEALHYHVQHPQNSQRYSLPPSEAPPPPHHYHPSFYQPQQQETPYVTMLNQSEDVLQHPYGYRVNAVNPVDDDRKTYLTKPQRKNMFSQFGMEDTRRSKLAEDIVSASYDYNTNMEKLEATIKDLSDVSLDADYEPTLSDLSMSNPHTNIAAKRVEFTSDSRR